MYKVLATKFCNCSRHDYCLLGLQPGHAISDRIRFLIATDPVCQHYRCFNCHKAPLALFKALESE